MVPRVHRTWREADGSGRTEVEWAEPEFENGTDPGGWASPRAGTGSENWQPGGRATSFGDRRPPSTVAELDRYPRRPNPPDDIGPIKTLVAVTDLLRERVLTPPERAATLELLGRLPDVRYQGATTDRIGRAAEAFSMDSACAGLPTRYTLLVSPDSGEFLGNEQLLTTSAGSLNVTVPAVIEYETYVHADFR
ncbi:hypothetical protein [Actinokineospora auranticolor]|uniref:hypothetical protein n=1 Tax=Actinokineospora auranticolor TaxID=155976 RepID=UPI0011B067F7|nr:hypothetical protein [Actinokineospora auranticolor]